MSNVLLLVVAVVSFITQVVYSIHYSISIVDISTKVNQIQHQVELEQIQVADIKSKYYQSTSISTLKSHTPASLKPITKTINLGP